MLSVYTLKTLLGKGNKETNQMGRSTRLISAALMLWLLAGILSAQEVIHDSEIIAAKEYRPLVVRNSPELEPVLITAINEMASRLRPQGFMIENISATLIDLREPSKFTQADYQGNRPLYPASVVKLFYMAA